MQPARRLKRGVFITLEGIEGAGKSTQTRHLQSQLEAQGYEVVTSREPGGTVIGEEIRGILKRKDWDGGKTLTSNAELLLFFAARDQHLSEVVKPALARGAVVLMDRFVASTYAYQCWGRNLPLPWVQDLEERVVGESQPDLTVILDLPPHISSERVIARGAKDRFEEEEQRFFERVRDGYLSIAKVRPKQHVVLDATERESAIANRIWERVKETLHSVPARRPAAAVKPTTLN